MPILTALLAMATTQFNPAKFAQVPPGTYRVGKTGMLDNPPRSVQLVGYRISKFDVTNAEFRRFIKATGYITDAERHHDAMVFKPGLPEFKWLQDPTAFWRFPNGKKRGGIDGKSNHPVTSISFADALRYCEWAKVRLPSMDEWEVACRAGTKTEYFFGDDETQIGKYANIWHGRDHLKPDFSDGYMYTSPVGSFKPNPWGLYDMYGNVFQFCTGRLPSDKRAGSVHSRGGSWWCSLNACCFFNSVDIGSVDIHASFSNQGFRIVSNH